jgi:hypothetical protein
LAGKRSRNIESVQEGSKIFLRESAEYFAEMDLIATANVYDRVRNCEGATG